jgi:anti-sigma regulatory factor (Ser/Thr protein kinase)
MDWYLPRDAGEGVSLLRHELVAYLRRHGDAASDFDAAELVVAESVGNAVRHTAGPVWVTLSWRGSNPLMSVYDLGPGLEPASTSPGPGKEPAAATEPLDDDADDDFDELLESGRGLSIMRELALSLEQRERGDVGLIVSVSLPITRPRAVDHDPPRRRSGALPMLSEALPSGGFGKESFLRALVVQLAHTIEIQHGQDAADAAVAQVGADVGGQMEEEFRDAFGLSDRLSPAQIGECFVRLKHAIDGGFRVLEATPERIVLVNDKCPFGSVVQQAPSLCRMTSSVFGGIAARNSDSGALVLLEERIAVGDTRCRVTVELGVAKADAAPEGHHYANPLP